MPWTTHRRSPHWGGKIGIDATKKGPDEGHAREWPPDVVMSAEVKAEVDRDVASVGLDRLGDGELEAGLRAGRAGPTAAALA